MKGGVPAALALICLGCGSLGMVAVLLLAGQAVEPEQHRWLGALLLAGMFALLRVAVHGLAAQWLAERRR